MDFLKDTDKKAYNLIRSKLLRDGIQPTLREINDVTGGKSPRSASIVIDRLVKLGLLKKTGNVLKLINNSTFSPETIETIDVPLLGSVSCGLPMFAEENIEAMIPVSKKLAKGGSQYFLLRADGDSMNLAGINSGDFILIKQQSSAENGQKVVALINDEATVKFFERTEGAIILKPKSNNPKNKPIIISDECQIQGVVVTVLPNNLNN
jgi:repressor LexA